MLFGKTLHVCRYTKDLAVKSQSQVQDSLENVPCYCNVHSSLQSKMASWLLTEREKFKVHSLYCCQEKSNG